MACGCGGGADGGVLEPGGGYPGSVLDSVTNTNQTSNTSTTSGSGIASLLQNVCTKRAQCWVILIALFLLFILVLRR